MPSYSTNVTAWTDEEQGMQTDVANGQTFDTVLMIASWLVLIFGTLWFVTGFLGWMHRRAYNLTRAESAALAACRRPVRLPT